MGQGRTAELGSDLDRLLAGERIQRPSARERAAGEWDWFDGLSPADRRWFGRQYMADIGDRPEDVARRNGHGTDVSAAMAEVLDAAYLERRTRARAAATTAALTPAEIADWAEADRDARRRDVLAELYGPQELAAIMGRTVPAVHQLHRRGRLPRADLIVSKVPMWHADTLRAAGILEED